MDIKAILVGSAMDIKAILVGSASDFFASCTGSLGAVLAGRSVIGVIRNVWSPLAQLPNPCYISHANHRAIPNTKVTRVT
jgi:hypothetical protein